MQTTALPNERLSLKSLEVEDLKRTLEQFQERLQELETKLQAREQLHLETQQREVMSRIARAVSDEHLKIWDMEGDGRTESDGQILVYTLRAHRIHFLPVVLTAKAISCWKWEGELLVPALALYSAEEVDWYLKQAIQNQEHQSIIDQAWVRLWDANDGIDLKLMLTAWANLSRFRNYILRGMLSVAFAKEVVDATSDFDETRGRAYEVIEEGVDWRGQNVFDNY